MPVPRNNLRFTLRKLYDWLDDNAGGSGSVAWEAVTDKPAVIAAGADAAAARSAIGAGTSNVSVGSGAANAAPGTLAAEVAALEARVAALEAAADE